VVVAAAAAVVIILTVVVVVVVVVTAIGLEMRVKMTQKYCQNTFANPQLAIQYIYFPAPPPSPA